MRQETIMANERVTITTSTGDTVVVTPAAFEQAVSKYAHLTIGALHVLVNERSGVTVKHARTWVESIARLADFDYKQRRTVGRHGTVHTYGKVQASDLIAMSDEDLFWSVAGAGAEQYGWYYRYRDDPAALTIDVVLDNGEGGSESATLTPASIRRTIESIVLDQPEFTESVQNVDWSDEEAGSDIDADIADSIVQYAVLGRVVFG